MFSEGDIVDSTYYVRQRQTLSFVVISRLGRVYLCHELGTNFQSNHGIGRADVAISRNVHSVLRLTYFRAHPGF